MKFTMVNVLHRQPQDKDYWQLHKQYCDDALKAKLQGYTIADLEADSVAGAQAAWIEGDLDGMGYCTKDVRVMPCCESAST